MCVQRTFHAPRVSGMRGTDTICRQPYRNIRKLSRSVFFQITFSFMSSFTGRLCSYGNSHAVRVLHCNRLVLHQILFLLVHTTTLLLLQAIFMFLMRCNLHSPTHLKHYCLVDGDVVDIRMLASALSHVASG